MTLHDEAETVASTPIACTDGCSHAHVACAACGNESLAICLIHPGCIWDTDCGTEIKVAELPRSPADTLHLVCAACCDVTALLRAGGHHAVNPAVLRNAWGLANFSWDSDGGIYEAVVRRYRELISRQRELPC